MKYNWINKRLHKKVTHRYKLYISNDYEHVHVYELIGREYTYSETMNVDIFRKLCYGIIIAGTMSKKAKIELIREYRKKNIGE